MRDKNPKFKIRNSNAPKGAVLLLALLIMSGMLITAATLGTIAVLSLRQGRVIDDSISAFAAAESGAEETMYQVRRLGTIVATLNANPNDTSSLSLSGPPMTTGKWSRVVSATETAVVTDLPKDKSYELTFWNPDAPTSPAGAESLKYTWNDSCGGTSALETLSVAWDPTVGGSSPFTAGAAFDGTSPALTYLYSASGVVDNAFIAGRAYRLRLRAKNCDVFNLNISAWAADNASGAVVSIPSRIILTSTGEYGAARQAMDVRLPRLQPLSGAFDYVLFSQCSILKGVSGPACP